MTTNEILEQRGNTYGDYSENARISQGLKYAIRAEKGYAGMPMEHKEALDVIFGKIARILNGDHMHLDNWKDIAGYSELVARFIEDNVPQEVEVPMHKGDIKLPEGTVSLGWLHGELDNIRAELNACDDSDEGMKKYRSLRDRYEEIALKIEAIEDFKE